MRWLLCVLTGRTLSLLPDFCPPRRQHGPAILGRFMQVVVFGGKSLLSAFLSAFLSRAVRIRA